MQSSGILSNLEIRPTRKYNPDFMKLHLQKRSKVEKRRKKNKMARNSRRKNRS